MPKEDRANYKDLVEKLLTMFPAVLPCSPYSLTWTDRDGDEVTNNTCCSCLFFCYLLFSFLYETLCETSIRWMMQVSITNDEDLNIALSEMKLRPLYKLSIRPCRTGETGESKKSKK